MMKLLQGLPLLLASFSASSQERSNVTSTTWEIYGIVAATLIVGFIVVYLKDKRDKRK
jgi:hypothetical protein